MRGFSQFTAVLTYVPTSCEFTYDAEGVALANRRHTISRISPGVGVGVGGGWVLPTAHTRPTDNRKPPSAAPWGNGGEGGWGEGGWAAADFPFTHKTREGKK